MNLTTQASQQQQAQMLYNPLSHLHNLHQQQTGQYFSNPPHHQAGSTQQTMNFMQPNHQPFNLPNQAYPNMIMTNSNAASSHSHLHSHQQHAAPPPQQHQQHQHRQGQQHPYHQQELDGWNERSAE